MFSYSILNQDSFSSCFKILTIYFVELITETFFSLPEITNKYIFEWHYMKRYINKYI